MQNSSSDLYDVIRVFFETKVDAVILDFQMTGGFDAGSGMFPCAAIIRWCYKNNIEQKPLQ
jgi:hypothetical protein